jgi:hypothetical protein
MVGPPMNVAKHSAASPQLVLIVWGRLVTCGGLVIRPEWNPELLTGRLPIAAHKETKT